LILCSWAAEAEWGKKDEESMTDHQVLNRRQRHLALKREIGDWCDARSVYIPIAKVLEEERARETITVSVVYPWHLRLWLPSSIPQELRASGCAAGLIELEVRARIASLIVMLSKIRVCLHLVAHAIRGTRAHIYGTGEKHMTRARAHILSHKQRLERAVKSYQNLYEALLILNPHKTGCELLRELRQEDVSGPTREVDEVILAQRGEIAPSIGTYTESWIWRTYGASASLDASGNADIQKDAEQRLFHHQLRTAWAKAQGRHERWLEEILLLCEEMCRTLAYLSWKSNWWLEQAFLREQNTLPHGDTTLASGLAAYAHEQSDIYHQIGREFALKWAPLLIPQRLDGGWLQQWLPDGYSPPPLKRSRAKVPLADPLFHQPPESAYLADLYREYFASSSFLTETPAVTTSESHQSTSAAGPRPSSPKSPATSSVEDTCSDIDIQSDLEADNYLLREDEDDDPEIGSDIDDNDILD
jgi:hypothetical protein